MEAFDAVGELSADYIGCHTEAAPGERRVVNVGVDYGTLRIDPQAGRHGVRPVVVEPLHIGAEPLPLAY